MSAVKRKVEDALNAKDLIDAEEPSAGVSAKKEPAGQAAADQQKSHGRGVAKHAAHPAPPPSIREEPLDYEAWVSALTV